MVNLTAVDQSVLLSTSFDEAHPPENVLTKDDDTFWITTGMFPQILVISLSEAQVVRKIRITSSFIKTLLIETSAHDEPEEFETKAELSLAYADGHQQVNEVPLHGTLLRHLRINITSGYDHFVAVYNVYIEKS